MSWGTFLLLQIAFFILHLCETSFLLVFKPDAKLTTHLLYFLVEVFFPLFE